MTTKFEWTDTGDVEIEDYDDNEEEDTEDQKPLDEGEVVV